MSEPTLLPTTAGHQEKKPVDKTAQQIRELDSSTSASEGDHVDVEAGQAQWNELSRQISKQSANHRAGDKDSEKDSEDEFDLAEYLRANQQASDESGIKHKRLGVVFENLEVVAGAGINLDIRTFKDALFQFVFWAPLAVAMKFGAFDMGKKKLLDGFSGCAKPGEMVFVLGRPGSGCSTFLKTIANLHQSFSAVNGDINYGGINYKEMGKKYRGEVVYNSESDDHYPSLTVRETLLFALRLKNPGKMLPEHSKASFRESILETTLKMLGISHTAETRVGGTFIRGVSGGEKKRVSIAEQLCARASIMSWDNSTRGLDASTALDYAKSIRLLTNIGQTTSFVSLYQAGEGIFNQFDKVLLIDQGHCVYYGPREEARPYFISLGFRDLPRSTSGDWLSGVTDPGLAPETRFQDGRDASNVPSTPEALAEAYQKSDVRKRVIQEMEAYKAHLAREKSIEEEFRAAVKEDKNKGVGKKSNYTVSFFTQVYALWLRQMQIKLGDKLDIAVSYSTTVIISLIIGSCYFQLPSSAADAFSRGGVLFLGLLFNALTSFSELSSAMGNRVIVNKQTQFALFRPSALTVANLLADIPFSFLRVLLFSIIIYFMAGLVASASNFFTFFIIIYVTFLALSSLFNIFGTACKSYDLAARIAAIIVIVLMMYAGYLLPRDAMPRWLFWISYITPLYYGFSAVMINEFKDINLRCIGTYITPRPVAGFEATSIYPTDVGVNQVCTLPGAQPGQQFVSGMDYLNASFGYKRSDLWLNFGIVCIFFVGLTIVSALAIELLDQGASIVALKVAKSPNAEEKKLEEALKERRQLTMEKGEQEETPLEVNSCSFTWEKLSYTVPVKGGERKLLNDVYGYCKPGTLTALMGASGAGKTTLLDVLADRKSIGVISGERLVNGRPVDRSFSRGCAYAEQQDVHEPTTTVREAMRFSAYLRQPASVSKEEKDAWVEECIALLEMEDIAQGMIGYEGTGFGLGVGDRKRCTIGVELAAKPDLLLFLDEPTSGLDGQTAYNVVRFLKKLANAGQAIMCTIHQPSSLLFEQFQNLLLLQRGGETVYFGPIGADSKHIIKYFADHGAQCPSDVNPAEYMLDAIGAGSQKRVGSKDWAQVYLESQLFKDNLQIIEDIKKECLAQPVEKKEIKEFATSFGFQLKTVLRRTLLSSYRSPDYQLTRLIQQGSIALLTSLTFLQLGNSIDTLQFRIFGVFVLTIAPAIILAQIEPFFIMARNVFTREDSSKMYSGVVFALSQFLSEIPYGIVCGVVYFLLFYFPIGFQYDSNRAGYFFAMTMVTEVFAITLGQAIASLSPSIYLASLVNPFFIIIMSLFCGVTIPAANMPKFYSSWLYQLDPFTRLVGGLIVNELHDLPIRCKPSELAIFNPPNGTCQSYAGAFVEAAGGYLSNPDATSDCGYCQFSKGDEFYSGLGLDFANRGRDIGVMIAFCVFNGIIIVFACKYLRFANR